MKKFFCETLNSNFKKIAFGFFVVAMFAGLFLTFSQQYRYMKLFFIPFAGILAWLIYPKKCIRLSALYAVIFTLLLFIMSILQMDFNGIHNILSYARYLGGNGIITFTLLLIGNGIAYLTHYALTKKVLWKRILNGLSSLGIVVALLWSVFIFQGNPLYYFQLNTKVKEYMSERYPNLEYHIVEKNYVEQHFDDVVMGEYQVIIETNHNETIELYFSKNFSNTRDSNISHHE